MHSPVPRSPSLRQPAALRAELVPFLTPPLAAAVSGARRRALRDGDRQIDTAHLLHSLVESDPEAAAVFEGREQLARVLGYLVQRSIGYGLRWQRSVEDSADRRLLPATRGTDSRDARPSGWSPAAAAALEGALRRAAGRGEPQARGVDLLAVVAADPESRAVEVLRRAGVDPAALAARADLAADPCEALGRAGDAALDRAVGGARHEGPSQQVQRGLHP
ncbi:Clp protease N-terminal domain-containing protein [Streptomyces sp. NPDC058861]|uniref:Clp protease N-terminal domain-containing protein n=1 Tax=Streptomyces sp. NPDC058861 TaxID=3346653 RepID=UPI0036C54ED2